MISHQEIKKISTLQVHIFGSQKKEKRNKNSLSAHKTEMKIKRECGQPSSSDSGAGSGVVDGRIVGELIRKEGKINLVAPETRR